MARDFAKVDQGIDAAETGATATGHAKEGENGSEREKEQGNEEEIHRDGVSCL